MKGLTTLPRSRKELLIIALAVLLFPVGGTGRAAGQTTEAPSSSAPQDSAVIPVVEVATRATEVSNLLRSFDALYASDHEIEKIRKEFPAFSARTAAALGRTLRSLQAQPTLEGLQTEAQVWRKSHNELLRWLDLLTRMADRLDTALDRLAGLQEVWSRTLDAARSEQAPAATIQQITAVLPAIAAAQTTLKTQRGAILDLQGRIADQAVQSEGVLADIDRARQKAVGDFATRERRPIWSAEKWSRARAEGPGRLREIAAGPWADIEQYLRDPSGGMPIHCGIFVVLAVLFYTMRRQASRWAPGEDASAVIGAVADAPLSAALVAALLFASSPTSPAPPIVRNLFEALALAPMIRVIRPAVDRRAVFGLYTLGLLFFLDMLRHAFTEAALFDQTMAALEALAGVAVLAWSLTYGSLRRLPVRTIGTNRLRVLRTGAGIVLGVLAFGLRASIVRTRQGAEIIVPNSQFISEQVTNWTLSDQLRRISLPVGVNYIEKGGPS